jgi:hypothetical protein
MRWDPLKSNHSLNRLKKFSATLNTGARNLLVTRQGLKGGDGIRENYCFLMRGKTNNKLLKGNTNSIKFTIKVSCKQASMVVKREKITINTSASSLRKIQKGTISVYVDPIVRRETSVDGFQGHSTKCSWTKLILFHL